MVVHPAVGVAGDALVPTLHDIEVIVTGVVLQSVVEQHEQALPVPTFVIVFVGHVDVAAHEYVVVPIVPVVYVESDFKNKKNKLN